MKKCFVKTLVLGLLLILQISVLSAQWTKIDDQSLDLRTILSNNFDTGIIIGWSSKLGNVISRDEGVSFQKFKSSISPYSYYIDKDTIYVGGYYNKVEYTTDYGLTFKDITTAEIKDKGVKCFAKYDNNTLLVGTIRNGIYAYNKSTGSWLNIGHKGQEISSILVKDNFIFAAVQYQDVSKSNDFGKTWTNVIYTNNNPATNLINYKGNIVMSTIGTGIKISYDNGANWKLLDSGLSGVPKSGNNLVLSKDLKHLFMVGYGEGVYYFNNELNKWEDINKDLPLSKRGEDIAISGNKIFVDVFPVQFDNTSYIYSLNISDKISSLTDGSSNSDKIKVFPNPSPSTLNITLSSQNIDAIFYIYDSDFRLIKNFKSDNSNMIYLDISSFKQGTYLLQTVLNQKSYYNTFVKI